MQHPVVKTARMVLVILGGRTLIGGMEEKEGKKLLHYPFSLSETIMMDPRTQQPTLSLAIVKVVQSRPAIAQLQLEGGLAILELEDNVKEDIALCGYYENAYKQARAAESGLIIPSSGKGLSSRPPR